VLEHPASHRFLHTIFPVPNHTVSAMNGYLVIYYNPKSQQH